jgi:Fe-S-cluster containining protein
MVDTFYLHLEFTNKTGMWSLNLPFLCTKCGVCCTLDDFLTAGEVKAQNHPEVQAKIKDLHEELGKIFEADEAKYDHYITQTPCPFLSDKTCVIYELRPDGCRQFPNTAFGMLTQNCEALTRFKRQRAALNRGRTAKRIYHFTIKPVKPAELTQKQYQSCVSKLRKAGITGDELALFNSLNRQEKFLS